MFVRLSLTIKGYYLLTYLLTYKQGNGNVAYKRCKIMMTRVNSVKSSRCYWRTVVNILYRFAIKVIWARMKIARVDMWESNFLKYISSTAFSKFSRPPQSISSTELSNSTFPNPVKIYMHVYCAWTYILQKNVDFWGLGLARANYGHLNKIETSNGNY